MALIGTLSLIILLSKVHISQQFDIYSNNQSYLSYQPKVNHNFNYKFPFFINKCIAFKNKYPSLVLQVLFNQLFKVMRYLLKLLMIIISFQFIFLIVYAFLKQTGNDQMNKVLEKLQKLKLMSFIRKITSKFKQNFGLVRLLKYLQLLSFNIQFQSIVIGKNMSDQQLNKIKQLFHCETQQCIINVTSLVKQAVDALGSSNTVLLQDQWQILSKKLNNKSKLTCLADKNHRLLLVKFIQNKAVSLYKSSYFNRAQINKEYLRYFQIIGHHNFSDLITIISKLKFIKKYSFNLRLWDVDDNLRQKMLEIMSICDTKKRNQNSNILKFMKIIEFQDSARLINEFKKLLKYSWTQKRTQEQTILERENTRDEEEILSTPELKEFYSMEFQNENIFDFLI